MESKQQSQKRQHDSHSRERKFIVGSKVWVRNVQKGDKWLPGIVMSTEGSVTYHVEMSNGQVRKCHTDQLRLRTVQADRPEPQVSPTLPPTSTTSANVSVPSVPDPPLVELSQEIDSPVVESSSNLDTSSAEPSPALSAEQSNVEPSIVQPNNDSELRRHSTRTLNPVNRYEPKW